MRLTKLPLLLIPLALAGSTAAATATQGATGRPDAAAPAVVTPRLVAVRTAQHPGYDRIVFQFTGGLPTTRSVEYVSQLYQDGSGFPIAVAGRGVLKVTMFPALDRTPEVSWPNAREQVGLALPNLVSKARAGEFEAVTTYGFGVASKVTVKRSTLTNPYRFVVDVPVKFTTVNRPVWMLDLDNYSRGILPYHKPVQRPLIPTSPAAGALDRVFAGPTDAEDKAGLSTVTSGATGWRNLSIGKGIARVHLTGGCTSRGSTVTVADQIRLTLKQFPTVKWVKVYDPAGRTERPNGSTDSIPECLEP